MRSQAPPKCPLIFHYPSHINGLRYLCIHMFAKRCRIVVMQVDYVKLISRLLDYSQSMYRATVIQRSQKEISNTTEEYAHAHSQPYPTRQRWACCSKGNREKGRLLNRPPNQQEKPMTTHLYGINQKIHHKK